MKGRVSAVLGEKARSEVSVEAKRILRTFSWSSPAGRRGRFLSFFDKVLVEERCACPRSKGLKTGS